MRTSVKRVEARSEFSSAITQADIKGKNSRLVQF